jgi:hypothetical protein
MSLPTPQAGDKIQVNIIGFLNEQTCITTFLYDCATATGTTAPDIQMVTKAIGDLIWDDPVAGMAAFCSSDLRDVAYTGQIVAPVRSIAVTVQPVTNTVGAGAAPAAPSGVAAVITRKGTIANRHNIGRIYLPAVPQSAIISSGIDQTSAAWMAMAQLANQMKATISVPGTGGASTFFPILAPKKTYTPVVPIQLCIPKDIIRYQRRRELHVGA